MGVGGEQEDRTGEATHSRSGKGAPAGGEEDDEGGEQKDVGGANEDGDGEGAAGGAGPAE